MSNFGAYGDLSSLFTKLKQRLALRPKTFTGTQDEWDELTVADRQEYEIVNITDDYTPSAGGGHIIEDSEGTELTQRDTLKVGGSLIAEDDSTNEKTIITDGMQTIDWEDWLEMTDEEKAAVPKALITNVPGLDSKLNVQFLKKLWENPSPSAEFTSQNITLSSNDYDFLLFLYRYSTSDNSVHSSTIVPKGRNAMLDACTTASGGTVTARRVCNYSSNTSYTFSTGFTATGATTAIENNSIIIPIAIYGFKASVDIDITAYMADLETDAKNVYLESGESVEEVLGKGSISVTADGVKTYSKIFNEIYPLIDRNKISGTSYLSITLVNGTFDIYTLTGYSATSPRYMFTLDGFQLTNMYIYRVIIRATDSMYDELFTSYTDFSSTKPESGTVLTLHY